MTDKARLMLGDRVWLTGESLERARTHLGGDGSDLIITDMMDRAKYNRPDRVGVKRSGSGLALGVSVADIGAFER